ncbi:MAG: ribonuclease R [candidate division Zixibacteria bacterium]|nr:ribonuclease R [candidate division Zixibacteria bacterium]
MKELTLDDIKIALSNCSGSPKIREFARLMKIPKTDYRAFRRIIREAISEGEIERLRGGRLTVPSYVGKVKGRLIVARSGFGFLIPDDNSEEMFIPDSELGGALHGETVIAELKKFRLGKNREGRIIKVLHREGKQLVGKLEKTRYGWRLNPNDPNIDSKIELAPPDGFAVKPDYIAVILLDEWRADYLPPTGKVVEILGPAGAPGVDIDALIKSSGVPEEFSSQTLTETRKIRKTIPKSELNRRTDLRNLTVFTIDPADAKDHDDAVSIEKLGDGLIRLGVHIADVSHYVKKDSWLDRDAFLRGNSIYLVDRVIPMLPEKLSADLCSLHEGVDRLALSVMMDFDKHGSLKHHEIVESVIKSGASLNYIEVQKCLDGEPSPKLEPFTESLSNMNKLASKLRAKRIKAGSLDFDLPEPKIVLDKEGNVVDIFRYPRYDSHRLVEEFMLMANCAVAKTMRAISAPILYRVHDKPDKLKVNNFAELLREMGYKFSFKGDITPKKFQRVLNMVSGKDDEGFIHRLLLRSLAKAVYQPDNIGHFGLAFDTYTHFTSPIRRYPDLHLHRAVKLYINKKLNSSTAAKLRDGIKNTGRHCSQTELQANELERESLKIKMVEYFSTRIGAVYSGVVSGVVRSGLFVEVDDLMTDGFLSYSSFDDDYYIYDDAKHQAIGRRNNKRYRLGDRIKIVVVKVDKEKREIDFMPAEKLKQGRKSKRNKRKK